MKQMQDDELINSFIKNGSEKAFAVLVERYTRTTIAFATKITGDISAAEDIVQDAFIKFYEKSSSFNVEGGNFKSWLFRVIYNSCIDFLRKNRRYNDLDENLVYEENTDVLNKINDEEKSQNLKEILDTLPSRQKEALILNYYEEYSQIDGAAVMNISLKAYESLLSRARHNLETRLKGAKND